MAGKSSISDALPPTDKMGVNAPSMPSFTLDWAAFTAPDTTPLDVIRCLVAGTSDWETLPHGARGYKVCEAYGAFRLAYGGSPGIHVTITGDGCKQLGERDGFQWTTFLGDVLALGAHFTRVDWACDAFDGDLSLDNIERHARAGAYTGASSQVRIIESWQDKISERPGKTIYFGSRTSERMLRFYDKAAETHTQREWVRCELETKGAWADASVDAYLQTGAKGLAEIIRAFLTFRVPGSDSHKHRWEVAPFWGNFLAWVERTAIVVARGKNALSQVANWFSRFMAPTLALFLTYSEGDLQALTDLAVAGKKRWTARHRRIIEAAMMQAA